MGAIKTQRGKAQSHILSHWSLKGHFPADHQGNLSDVGNALSDPTNLAPPNSGEYAFLWDLVLEPTLLQTAERDANQDMINSSVENDALELEPTHKTRNPTLRPTPATHCLLLYC